MARYLANTSSTGGFKLNLIRNWLKLVTQHISFNLSVVARTVISIKRINPVLQVFEGSPYQKKKRSPFFFFVGLQNVIQLYKYNIDECENKVHQPSAKVVFLMLPTPPSPSTNSMLLMNWGMILGMGWMSRIKALNILAGETLVVISWVKVVTPMLEIVWQIFWCQGRKWIRLVEERVVEIRNNKLGIYRN